MRTGPTGETFLWAHFWAFITSKRDRGIWRPFFLTQNRGPRRLLCSPRSKTGPAFSNYYLFTYIFQGKEQMFPCKEILFFGPNDRSEPRLFSRYCYKFLSFVAFKSPLIIKLRFILNIGTGAYKKNIIVRKAHKASNGLHIRTCELTCGRITGGVWTVWCVNVSIPIQRC